ncbi:hypothetical protein NPIL_29891, partial [Nephila pilipes]
MEQDSINKSLYKNYNHVYENQPISNSYSYEQSKVKRCNASKQIVSCNEFILPPFGYASPLKVTSYNIPPDPIYSVQDILTGNNLSNTPLPQQVTDNCSNFSTFSPTTVSSAYERSQEILDGSSSNVFSNNTTCVPPKSMYDCFDGGAMDYGMALSIHVPEIHFFEDLKLHETDQTNLSEESWKDLTSHMASFNSFLKCVICSKEFSTEDNLQKHLFIHNRENKYECEKCFKKFPTKADLQNHLPINNAEKKV